MKNRGYFKKVQGKWKLSLLGREALAGLGFALPFLIGFFFIFLPMIVKSVSYSFSNMDVQAGGYVLTPAAKNGLEHYIRALTIDPDFNRMLLRAILDMFTKVPLVIIFSFFMANLLNQKFHGRAVARSILFLPVILTSGVILGLESSDLLVSTLSPAELSGTDFSTIMNVSGLLLEYTDLPPSAIKFLASAVNGIYGIIIASGVQILIFLAGLQSISPSLYEASSMEGATAWESFWKITFPMISPMILVNAVYTVIDSFTSQSNSLMRYISNIYSQSGGRVRATAMSWMYFLVVIIVLVIVAAIIKAYVFYQRRDT